MSVKLPNRTFEVSIQLKFQKGPGADDTYRALAALAHNPAMIAKLVKVALAETVLRAYEERFKIAEPLMMHMEILDDANKRRRNRTRRRQKIMQEFADRVRDQIAATNAGTSERGSRSYDDLWQTYKEQTASDDFQVGPGGKSNRQQVFESVLYRGGEGRQLLQQGMAEVLRLIAGTNALQVSHVGGQTVVGIGDMEALERVRTPSYTEYAKEKQTASKFTVLWRQLEFGTGYYARPDREKTWWRYAAGSGRNRVVLRIRGSRGGHFLRTAAGLPYDADAVRFQGVFNTLLVQTLAGKGL